MSRLDDLMARIGAAREAIQQRREAAVQRQRALAEAHAVEHEADASQLETELDAIVALLAGTVRGDQTGEQRRSDLRRSEAGITAERIGDRVVFSVPLSKLVPYVLAAAGAAWAVLERYLMHMKS